jgi:capsular exopolysaccharide synthesis family protein
MDHDAKTVLIASSSESLDVLAGTLRFARSLQTRKGVLAIFMVASSVLGALYYLLAGRVYQSQADLLVLDKDTTVMNATTGQPHMRSEDMPTYEKMVKSANVVQATMRAVPHEHLRDLRGVHPDRWEEAFRDRLTVSTARNTNLMTITYRSGDPETAYVVLNALITEYINVMNSVYRNDAQERLTLLEKQLEEYRAEIDHKQHEYMSLLASSRAVFDDGEVMTNVYADRAKALNVDLIDAQKRTLHLESQLRAIEQAIRNGEDMQQFALRMSEVVGTELLRKHIGVGVVDSTLVARMMDDLIDQKADLAYKLQHYGRSHPIIREIETRIQEKERTIAALPQAARESASHVTQHELGPQLLQMARQDYQQAVDLQHKLALEYDQASQQAADFNTEMNRLKLAKGELATLQEQRDNLWNTIVTIGLDTERGLSTSVASQPKIDRTPVSPRLPLVVVISLFLGFSGACATTYVMDLLDDRFHSADDLRTQLRAPILTTIRRLSQIDSRGLESLHTFARPNSPDSEPFRTLRAALDFTSGGIRRLTISSTEPSDGKTTVLANLAVAFAQSGKRTLVIDGDMRRPGLTKLFERSGHPGLSTVLRDERPIVESVNGLVHQTRLENLHVLPAGPRPVNPVELLTHDRLADLLGWAETNYDQVLIDAPPSLAVTDAAIIGRLVDGAILTVRPDKNRRKLVLRAAEALTTLGCELLGVVINAVQPTSSDHYGFGYGYGYGYGHDEHAESDDPQGTASRSPAGGRDAPPGAATPLVPRTNRAA